MPPVRTFTMPPLLKDQHEYLERIKEESRPPTQKEKDNFLIPGPNFDKSLSPWAPVNRASAKVREWTYDHQHHMYRNKDGSFIADKFGQLL